MLTVKQKNSTDFNRANNSCKAFDWQKFYSIPGKVFWFVSLNNIILNSSANKPITNWGQEAKKGLEGRSPQWHPSVECCDTLHHTWTFNTRRKTRRENSIAKKHVHFSIHLDFLPHHLEEIQISQEIVQTSELSLPSLDLEAKRTVSFGHSSPGKYCLGTFRNQSQCPCQKFSSAWPHIQSLCTEEPRKNLFLEAL